MVVKHLAFIRKGFQVALQFRAESFLWIVIDFLPFVAMAFVWQSIFSGNASTGNYSLGMVLQHYLLVILIQRLCECHFESWRAEEIRTGKIDFYLIRPYSFIQQILTEDVSGKVLSFLLFIPALITYGLFIFNLDPTTAVLNLTSASLLAFTMLVLAAYAMHFTISLLIVFLTFWFEGSNGLEHFKWAAVALLSGGIMPFDLMPEGLRLLINYLPFKYMYAVPIRVIQGTYAITITDWMVIIISLSVLFTIATLLWNKGRNRYASAGG